MDGGCAVGGTISGCAVGLSDSPSAGEGDGLPVGIIDGCTVGENDGFFSNGDTVGVIDGLPKVGAPA